MTCCDTCPSGAVLGTVQENITSVMSPIVNGGIPFVGIVGKRPLGVADFMFDKNVVEDSEGRKILQFKFKDGMGSGSKFQYLRTNSDCQLEWREQFYSIPSAKIADDESASLTITVDSIAKLRGIGKGAKIQVFSGNKLQSGTIESISGNIITLIAGDAMTVAEGDCVYRGAYSRSKDCQTNIDNKYDLRQEVKYVSNYRNISLSLEFFTCDLSVDRFVNYMGENGSNRFINEYKQAAVEGFVEEFRSAFWQDRNLKGGVDLDSNVVDSSGANETMGLLPAIKRAQTSLDKTLIRDHGTCCADESTCGGDENLVASFFDVIRIAHKSGLYTNNVVTVVGNSKFIEALQKMQAAFNDVNGVQVTYEQPTSGTYSVRQTLPSINLGGIVVEFMQDEWLERFPYSMYVVLPVDQIYFTQRAYGHLTSDMAVTNEINGNISTGFPWLKFADRTMFETNGLGDCYKFVSDFEFAIAFGGMDHCAYHIGINFEPCVDTCNVCDETTRTNVI